MAKEGKILKRKSKAPKDKPIKRRKKRTIKAEDKFSWCAFTSPENKTVTLIVDKDWDVISEKIE